MADRTDAFVSYSHADQAWLQRIKVHLRPLERDHGIVIWQDTNLRGGQRWQQEINTALAKAKVAILLVSPDFLASDFIHNDELPPLLEAAEKDGLTILSIIVSACAFRHSPLSEFQAINTPDTPLDLLPAGEVNRVLVKLFQRVAELFAAPSKPTHPRPVADKAPRKEPQQASIPAVSQAVAEGAGLLSAPSQPAPQALLVKADGQWNTIAVTFSQIGNRQLSLTLQPNTPLKRAFLTNLTQRNALSSVVYNEQTYSCVLRELDSFTEGGRTESWRLTADTKDLSTPQDIVFNGIQSIDQARVKAQAILLNQRPANDQERSPFGRFLTIPEDYISPLFVLYHTLQRNIQQFQQIAPLVAAWHLQMHGIVTDIFELSIQLRGAKLSVTFEGQRHSQYHDQSPDIVEVKGECDLPEYLPSDALPLYLIKPAR